MQRYRYESRARFTPRPWKTMSSTTAKTGQPTRLWSRTSPKRGQRAHTYLAPISAFELGNPDSSPSDMATRSDGVSESGIAVALAGGVTHLDISVSYNLSHPGLGDRFVRSSRGGSLMS